MEGTVRWVSNGDFVGKEVSELGGVESIWGGLFGGFRVMIRN